ncbi:Protein mak11 [Maublancomyces gigas]|uniref:Protein mak11 n=1 Tax=Discina gigas TaxID=1032678 RepID=A0ABR3GIW8_9PEZI
MAKRKRTSAAVPEASDPLNASPTGKPLLPPVANLSISGDDLPTAINFQVITGSYEKTLHGFIVSIPESVSPPAAVDTNSIPLPATFTDSFLFTAHTSPIQTLAVSPASSGSGFKKRILATSSADEHIHLYTLTSALAPNPPSQKPTKATSSVIASNPNNKHLGTLSHHHNTPTALVFTPTRSKLISAGLDGQIHILRARDWALLSTLKCPKPKARPINFAKDYTDGYGPRIETFSSDGGYGGGAGGVNDMALHPSQKILLSVSKGERGVRMWNLMTGRKAGVLMFGRNDIPLQFGREGTKVEWSADGSEYAVAFERGVVVFGTNSKPKLRIAPTPNSKIHQIRYMTLPMTLTHPTDRTAEGSKEVLAISTEDGRVLFYLTTSPTPSKETEEETKTPADIDTPHLIGILGGKSLGMPTRVKDFSTIFVGGKQFIITAGSDGAVRVWDLDGSKDAAAKQGREMKKVRIEKDEKEEKAGERQVGALVGIYETERRITCLGVMEMEVGEEKEEVEVVVQEEESDDSSEDDEDE